MTVEITRLENGLTVATDAMAHLETSSLGIWVDTGARHETPSQHGISHMLEHMAFKGTARRSARDIAEEIENAGGHLNAHTAQESTAYYARVLKDDVPLAIDLLGDILQNSTFAAEELERERGVIIQEIGQANDTPDDLVFDHFLGAAFPGQALGRPILGTVDTVSGFGHDDLQGYMDERYSAQSMVLVGAGAVDHEALVARARDVFGDLPSHPARGFEAARFQGCDRREERDLEQAHLIVGFEGVPYGDPDYYAAQVASAILGGGMSSRLFQEVREKRGLCYTVFSFAWSFSDTGAFGFYAGTDPQDLGELVSVAAGEALRLGEDVTETEVSRARAQMKAGLLMALESSSSRIEQIARQHMIYGRVLSMEETLRKVEAVDVDAVKKAAQRIFHGKQPAVAAVGPLGSLESYEKIAANFV